MSREVAVLKGPSVEVPRQVLEVVTERRRCWIEIDEDEPSPGVDIRFGEPERRGVDFGVDPGREQQRSSGRAVGAAALGSLRVECG